jgi:hypothetical protein
VVVAAGWALPAAAQTINGEDVSSLLYRAEQLQRQKESDWKAGQAANMAAQARFREEVRKTLDLARTLPAVPAARNPVLGKWMTEASQRPKPKEMDLIGQINQIGASGVCIAMFADGVINFRPQDWAIDDFDGNDSLGPVSYRGKGEMIYVVPAAGAQVIAFAVESKDKLVAVQLSNAEPCALFRVPEATTFANRPRPGRPTTTTGTAARPGAPAPGQPAAARPPAPGLVAVPPGQDRLTVPLKAGSAKGAAMRASIDPRSLLGQGIALRNELEIQKAMIKLQEAARASPNDAKVHVYLADTYYRLSMMTEGKSAETRARQLDPGIMEIFE